MGLIRDVIESAVMPSALILYLLIVGPAYAFSKQALIVNNITYSYIVDAVFYGGLLFFAYWGLWFVINWIRDTLLRRS